MCNFRWLLRFPALSKYHFKKLTLKKNTPEIEYSFKKIRLLDYDFKVYLIHINAQQEKNYMVDPFSISVFFLGGKRFILGNE